MMNYEGSAAMINLNSLDISVRKTLEVLDNSYIRTGNYMGIAKFWGDRYSSVMRRCSQSQRRMIMSKFLNKGLPLGGESQDHAEIIAQVLDGKKLYGDRDPIKVGKLFFKLTDTSYEKFCLDRAREEDPELDPVNFTGPEMWYHKNDPRF